MFKKIAILFLALALMGCCTKFNPDSGEVSKNFMNCIEKAKEKGAKLICSFSAKQIEEAGEAAKFLKIVFGPNYSAAVDRAIAALLNIHAGLCVAPDQLQAALDQVDVAVVVNRPVTVQGKAMAQVPGVVVPKVTELRKALKK